MLLEEEGRKSFIVARAYLCEGGQSQPYKV